MYAIKWQSNYEIIEVPTKSPKAIMKRLQTLRQQSLIQDLLPLNIEAVRLISANPDIPVVIRIANNSNAQHAQNDFIEQISTMQTHANYDHRGLCCLLTSQRLY